jgi:hypothetical protein
MRGIDPQVFKVLDGRRAEQVVPNSCHHEDVRSAEPGGYRLVRAFPTKPQNELLAKDSFSGLGELVRECGQVDISAADNSDARTFCHNFLVDTGTFKGQALILK